MKLTAHLALAALLVAGALGCAGGGPRPATDDALRDVPLVTLDGKETNLATLIGDRVAVFKFGATWCPPCTRQLAEFNQVRKAYPDDQVAVIDIDAGEPADLVRRHARKHGVTFTTVLDPQGEAARAYGVQGIPVTIVADRDRTILYRGHYTPFSKLKPHIDSALDGAADKGAAGS
ncbi:MAG: TlpA family protein disulfide reductase [Planctomycetota bacterium]